MQPAGRSPLRRWGIATLASLGLVAILLPSSAGQADWNTAIYEDPRAAQPSEYLEGSLTWNAGVGGITWGGTGADSGDNMPPDPRGAPTFAGMDTSGAEAAGADMHELAFDYDRYVTQPGSSCIQAAALFGISCVDPSLWRSNLDVAPNIPTTTFRSQPLPDDIFVNVTRGFQVELIFKVDDVKIYNEQTNPNGDNTQTGGSVLCSIFQHSQPRGQALGPVKDQGFDPTFVVGGVAPFTTFWLEPGIEASLKAKKGSGPERIVGGAITEQYSYPFSYKYRFGEERQPGMVGYQMCVFHMHPEEMILEKDTVLTLSLDHVMQSYWFPMGMQGLHASKLRIWKYTPEDVTYRYPILTPQEGTEADGSDGGSGGFNALLAPWLAGAALAGAAPAGLRAAGGRRVLLTATVLLLLAAAMGGCLSGSSNNHGASTSGPSGAITNDFVPDLLNISQAGKGSILGVVKDDLNIAVGGVHVTIYGATDFTTTDGSGRFKFFNVTPGVQKIRFDKVGYKTYEAPVEVRANLVSTPVITMFLLVDPERDFRPHPHDNWNGLDELTLGTFELPAPQCLRSWQDCRTDHGTNNNLVMNEFRMPAPTAGKSYVVFPGTWRMDVTFTWTAAELAGIDKIGLRLDVPYGKGRHASSFSNAGSYDHALITFAPRASGQTTHITTSWEMTDNGHATISNWVFGWWIPVGEAPLGDAYAQTQDAGWTPGKISVTIKVHRGGVLPLEPAHKDPWQGGTTISYAPNNKQTATNAGYIPNLPAEGGTQCADLPPAPIGVVDTCYDPQYGYWNVGHSVKDVGSLSVVPADAQWMEVTLTRTRMPEPEYFEVKLYFRPAKIVDDNQWLNARTLSGYVAAERSETDQDEVTHFKFKVPAELRDDIYLAQPWKFAFRPVDEAALQSQWKDAKYYEVVGSNLEAPLLEYSLAIKVHKDAWPG